MRHRAVRPATADPDRWYRRSDAHPAPLHDRRHRPVPVRPRRGGPGPDAHHADRRQAQGDRQGRPPADVAARRQPRAVRRADRRPGPRPDLRRRHRGERRARLAASCATRSSAPRRRGTSPSWPTARSRSATRPSRCTRSCGGPTSCSTPGWRPAASRAGTRCTCSTSSASRPEVDRCVECDRVLESDERFRWVPAARRRRVPALPGSAARPGGPVARGPEAAQGLPAPRHRGASPACASAAGGRARDRGRPARVRARRPRARRPLAGLPRRGPPGAGPRPALP